MLGQQFGGERDMYRTLGYDRNPDFDTYWNRYQRQDVATRVIVEPVNSTWRQPPDVTESDDASSPTSFDTEFEAFAEDTRLFHYLARTDRLAGVGQYAVLLIGFDDAQPIDQPVRNAKQVLFLAPYSQANADVNTWNNDETDPRFGLPETYRINTEGTKQPLQGGNTKTGRSRIVHWTRIIHFPSDGVDESEIYGTPRLKNVLNRLMDLEKVVGGGAEMFWRGAFPGMVFKADKDTEVDEESLEAEIQEYVHEMRRYLQVQGVDTQELKPQVADPTGHVGAIVDLISGAKGMPKRKLLGSERGEMASGQDETNWNAVIGERRQNHVNPVVRAVVNRMVEAGVLPRPAKRFTISWAPTSDISPAAQAQVARDMAQAIAAYVNAVGAPSVVPIDVFLSDVLNLDAETVREVRAKIDEQEAADRLDELADDMTSGGEGEAASGSREGAAADQSREADTARS